MSARSGKTQRARLAELLVDLIGPGPEDDPLRVEQARVALTAWSSAQSSLVGALFELRAMRDNPEYAETRFEGWD